MNTPSECYFADELRAAIAELDASGGDIQVTVMLPGQEAKTFSLSKPRKSTNPYWPSQEILDDCVLSTEAIQEALRS